MLSFKALQTFLFSIFLIPAPPPENNGPSLSEENSVTLQVKRFWKDTYFHLSSIQASIDRQSIFFRALFLIRPTMFLANCFVDLFGAAFENGVRNRVWRSFTLASVFGFPNRNHGGMRPRGSFQKSKVGFCNKLTEEQRTTEALYCFQSTILINPSLLLQKSVNHQLQKLLLHLKQNLKHFYSKNISISFYY